MLDSLEGAMPAKPLKWRSRGGLLVLVLVAVRAAALWALGGMALLRWNRC